KVSSSLDGSHYGDRRKCWRMSGCRSCASVACMSDLLACAWQCAPIHRRRRRHLRSQHEMNEAPAREPVPASRARSFHLDLPRPGSLGLHFRNVHGEDAVLALAANALRARAFRKREAPRERAMEALDAVILLRLVFLLVLSLAFDRNHSLVD